MIAQQQSTSARSSFSDEKKLFIRTKINKEKFIKKILIRERKSSPTYFFDKSTFNRVANCFPKSSSTLARTSTDRRMISLSVHCCKCSTIF